MKRIDFLKSLAVPFMIPLLSNCSNEYRQLPTADSGGILTVSKNGDISWGSTSGNCFVIGDGKFHKVYKMQ